MIIDPTDFVDRPYKVPNQQESGDFTSFIGEKETKLAEEYLLGVELWAAFQAGLDTSGTIEQRWLNLRDGATYVRNNKTYRYKGWVDTIRPGIYSLWQPVGTWKFTNVGWVENKANSAPQAGNQTQFIEDQYVFHVQYWNDFAKKVGYDPHCAYNCINTLYGFLKANESDYDDWVFKCPTFKNRHDL